MFGRKKSSREWLRGTKKLPPDHISRKCNDRYISPTGTDNKSININTSKQRASWCFLFGGLDEPMEMSSDAFWAIVAIASGGVIAWLIRMERLTTQLVEHGKNSLERHDKAEQRLDTHELEIMSIKNTLNANK